MMQRNNYIDCFKGFAVISVIAIHTAFWGGQSYTPEWFWNITLFVDVPFFFYLSGWGTSYRAIDIGKSCKSVINIWLKWIYFVTLLALICIILKCLGFNYQGIGGVRDLFENYMFNVSFPDFCVVGGSIWFMEFYITVVIINAVIIKIIETLDDSVSLKKTYMFIMLGLVIWITYRRFFFGIDVLYFAFYSFFWMLGYNRMGKITKTRNLVLCIVLCLALAAFASYLQNLPLYELQAAKFPPSPKYLFTSMIIVFISKHCEYREIFVNKLLVHIGRNALFYFFGQGIGSSINYYVVDMISIKYWFVKWLITFAINICVTILVSETIAITYYRIEGICCSIFYRVTREDDVK